jgi:hypothetical protein
MMKRVLTIVLMSCAFGCGGLSYTVDRDLLTEVSVENKLILFDAENDLSIQVDERENIRRQISELRQDIKDAESKIREAEQDIERAGQKNDAAAAQVGELARQTYFAKIDFLEEQLDLLRERMDMQERVVYVAWAKFELAKAKLVKKNNVRGASDIDLADFEAQVDKYVEKAKDDQERLKSVEEKVAAAEQAWIAQREQLRAASGGGQGSEWAEDGATWGY